MRIAGDFAKHIKPGDVVCLYGGLGAGKTAFAAGFAKGLGYAGYVTSPTFTLINEYQASLPIYHFDLYRIEHEDEAYNIGADEFLFGDGVCVIEWADKIAGLLPERRYEVTITKCADMGFDYREIEIMLL